jgi:dipeptidyl aminopeptidase/acylaminoacyl peptidase
VATLLAHSDLFRAGIARSGAYNHTLRPFGFQSERRTLWDAKGTYLDLSPVLFAPDIDEPLLLVHGAIDENPGTVPLQSERLFEAVRGSGGTARLVLLPFEGHAYQAKESVEHVLWEQLEWFRIHVKEAAPRSQAVSTGGG